jgi:hypothetical protein
MTPAESSVPHRPKPLPEVDSDEPEVKGIDDELDEVGKNGCNRPPLIRFVAHIILLVEPESAGFVSPFSWQMLCDLLTSWNFQRLQFIGETGKSRPKGVALRMIRSQARRKWPDLIRKRNSLSKQVVNIRPKHGPASNRIDPFNSLVIDERGNSHYLIRQCKLPTAL